MKNIHFLQKKVLPKAVDKEARVGREIGVVKEKPFVL